MQLQMKNWGGLSCRVVDDLPEGGKPTLAVIFCHGYGAPGDDLVPLAPQLAATNPDLQKRVQFIFPEAPLSLDEMGVYGGRAWWHLDIERLNAAFAGLEVRDLRNELPEGLPVVREMLIKLIDDVKQETGLPASRVFLGGFSQGAMLATDVALRLPELPAGLCVFSGTVLCEEVWRDLMAQRGPIPVLMSHGRQDPLLPFQAAVYLKEMFTLAGIDVDFVPFDGQHTISQGALQHLAALLGGLAAEPPATKS